MFILMLKLLSKLKTSQVTAKYLILKMLVYLTTSLVDILGYFSIINNPIMNITFKTFSSRSVS